MVSEKDKEILESIKVDVSVIRSKLEPSKIRFIYKYVSDIIIGCDRMNDQKLAKKIKSEAASIMSTQDLEEIGKYLDGIIILISDADNIEEEKGKKHTFLDVKKTEESDRFKDDIKTYSSWEDNTRKLQQKILTWPDFEKNLHQRITSGKWEGYLHARISGNLRLMYIYDSEEKSVLWDAIITKNEFDKSRR